MYANLQQALLAAREGRSRMCTCAAFCRDSSHCDGPEARSWCGCWCHLKRYEDLMRCGTTD